MQPNEPNRRMCRDAQQHLDNIEEIVAACAEDKPLHIMNLCELGGHRRGLAAANINVLDMNVLTLLEDPSSSDDEFTDAHNEACWG